MATLSFKQADATVNQAAAAVAEIRNIVYEDSNHNQYVFGTNAAGNDFDTLRYIPATAPDQAAVLDNNALGAAKNYSDIAKDFMTGGGVARLLDKLAAIEIATNAANLGDKLDEIKDKTDTIPNDFTAKVDGIKAKTDNLDLADTQTDGKLGKVLKEISDKTDTIPNDFTAKVDGIKAKTDNLDLADTQTDGKLGKVLKEISDKTNFIPDTLTADVTAIKTKTDNMPNNLTDALNPLAKAVDVAAIKTKTDFIPDTFNADVATIKTQVGAGLISGIKAKTDNMPDNLKTELGSLTTIANTINNNNLDAAAKSKLQNTFNEAVKKAIDNSGLEQHVQSKLEEKFKAAFEAKGDSAQTWFENHVRDVMSKPVFEIPNDPNVALNWDF